MENENQVKNEEVKNECKHPMHHKMHMITIILSIVAIVFSSFSLGFTISANRHQNEAKPCIAMQDNARGMMGMPNQFNPWANNNWSSKRSDKQSNENFTPNFERPSKESKGPSEEKKN